MTPLQQDEMDAPNDGRPHEMDEVLLVRLDHEDSEQLPVCNVC